MPLYDYVCYLCGKEAEEFVKLGEPGPSCCGVDMVKALSAPAVQPDNTGYRSQVTGEWIGSRTAHKKHLKTHGLVEVGNEKMSNAKPKEVGNLKREIADRVYGYR